MAYAAPCVIQTHNPSHPLINALLANQGSIYMLENIQKNKELCLPPFGQQIVCSYPGEEIELVTALRQQLLPLLEADWELSHPFKAPWHKKEYFHLMLRTSFPETRLSTAIRRILVALPRPWKVQHNPWYLF